MDRLWTREVAGRVSAGWETNKRHQDDQDLALAARTESSSLKCGRLGRSRYERGSALMKGV